MQHQTSNFNYFKATSSNSNFPKSGTEFDMRVVELEDANSFNDECLERARKGKDCLICSKRKDKNRAKRKLVAQLEFQKDKINYSGQLKLSKYPNFQTRLCKERKDALETMVERS